MTCIMIMILYKGMQCYAWMRELLDGLTGLTGLEIHEKIMETQFFLCCYTVMVYSNRSLLDTIIHPSMHESSIPFFAFEPFLYPMLLLASRTYVPESGRTERVRAG